MSRPEPILRALPILILHPHSRCNCRCVMCDIWKITAAEEITLADLERHAADIERLNVRWVVFSGGEPLMHSDLFRLAARLRKTGIRNTLLSTGLTLESQAAKVVANLDDVIVSLDGPADVHDRIRRVPGAFERLAAGVRALRKHRARFPVSGRCTVQRLNHTRLRETVEEAKRLDLDSLSFLAADLTSAAFNRPSGWSLERRSGVAIPSHALPFLHAEIESLITDYSPEIQNGFIAEGPEKLRRVVRHFRAHAGSAAFQAPRCNAPWVSAVVEADGTVRPCFFHPPLGNARNDGLLNVLNGPVAVAFRKALDVATDPVCLRCTCSLYWTAGRMPRSSSAVAPNQSRAAGLL
jgi:MoaA/NifB/PqqE/SkfB family radical SAM enzyme